MDTSRDRFDQPPLEEGEIVRGDYSGKYTRPSSLGGLNADDVREKLRTELRIKYPEKLRLWVKLTSTNAIGYSFLPLRIASPFCTLNCSEYRVKQRIALDFYRGRSSERCTSR